MQPSGDGDTFGHIPRGETSPSHVTVQLGDIRRVRHSLSDRTVHSSVEHLGSGKNSDETKSSAKLLESQRYFLLQGWRITYYGSGVITLIVAILTWLTLREPERKSIGEDAAATTGAPNNKVSVWKVMMEPRIVMLCIAASIRHCGKPFN